jgi:uncharacterized protein (DUF433 family)
MMEKTYVEERDGSFVVTGSRVSLDSLVIAFEQGLSPETIAGECYPVLTLEQVYGAIAYYLAHREQVDTSISRGESELDGLRQEARRTFPDLAAKLSAARRQASSAGK